MFLRSYLYVLNMALLSFLCHFHKIPSKSPDETWKYTARDLFAGLIAFALISRVSFCTTCLCQIYTLVKLLSETNVFRRHSSHNLFIKPLVSFVFFHHWWFQ